MSGMKGTEIRQVGTWHIRTRQGQKFTRTQYWRRQDTGQPYDFTGYSARQSVRNASGTEVLLNTTGNGRITLGGAAGSATWLILTSVMDAVTPSPTGLPYHHYTELIDGAGETIFVLQGEWLHEAKYP